MKRLFLFSLLIPFSLFAQETQVVEITCLDNFDEMIPNVNLKILFHDESKNQEYKFDSIGVLSFNIEKEEPVILTLTHDKFLTQHIKLFIPQDVVSDTIKKTINLEPMLTVLHGFYELTLDSFYTIGNISQLPNSIIIEKNHKRIPMSYTSTKLLASNFNRYNLHFYPKKNYIVYRVFRKRLKVKLKKNDEVVLKFGKKKKRYFIIGFIANGDLFYELTKV